MVSESQDIDKIILSKFIVTKENQLQWPKDIKHTCIHRHTDTHQTIDVSIQALTQAMLTYLIFNRGCVTLILSLKCK